MKTSRLHSQAPIQPTKDLVVFSLSNGVQLTIDGDFLYLLADAGAEAVSHITFIILLSVT